MSDMGSRHGSLLAPSLPSTQEKYHVVPIDDLREHIIDESCWCHPHEDDGTIIHNSMDLREKYEMGKRQPH